MKRYYDQNGEPDEAKTLWVFLTKCLWGFALFAVICIIWNSCNKHEPSEKKPHWINQGERPLTEVKWYDYSNGVIHWRDEYPSKPQEIIYTTRRSYHDDGITLRVEGASVHLNMSTEELLDQLTEDADFYEYFERNMD